MYTIDSKDTINFSVQSNSNKASLNFNGGAEARHVADSKMAECDREEACEHNKKLKAEGKAVSERVHCILL